MVQGVVLDGTRIITRTTNQKADSIVSTPPKARSDEELSTPRNAKLIVPVNHQWFPVGFEPHLHVGPSFRHVGRECKVMEKGNLKSCPVITFGAIRWTGQMWRNKNLFAKGVQ